MKNVPLINARKKKGFTQEVFAKKLGVKKGTVSNWENGHSNPTLEDAFKVADELDEDVNNLFSHLKVQGCHTGRKEAI